MSRGRLPLRLAKVLQAQNKTDEAELLQERMQLGLDSTWSWLGTLKLPLGTIGELGPVESH